MTWREELGVQIREARKRAGKSQKQLAADLSIERPQLSNIENGKSSTAVNVVAEIAEALETEFHIRGCTISRKNGAGRTAPPPKSEQLCLKFDVEQELHAVSLRIRPTRAVIYISAVIETPR